MINGTTVIAKVGRELGLQFGRKTSKACDDAIILIVSYHLSKTFFYKNIVFYLTALLNELSFTKDCR